MRPAQAVDHLQGLLQTPAHPVEGPTEHGDLVLALLGQLRDLEVAGADLIGRCAT